MSQINTITRRESLPWEPLVNGNRLGEKYTDSMSLLLAVHLSDFLMSDPWLIGGAIITAALLFWACADFPEKEIPRTALLTAAFFVSSSYHLKFGLGSVHLLLNGLVGAILGRRMPLAIVIGLVLQAVLLGHGGYYVLGLNAAIITLPGLFSSYAFRFLLREPLTGNRAAIYGALTGSISVLLTITVHAAVLIFGGREDMRIFASSSFFAHLPLAIIEGLMLAGICRYLAVVKPEMLTYTPSKIKMKAGDRISNQKSRHLS